jgi:hypothetical protein
MSVVTKPDANKQQNVPTSETKNDQIIIAVQPNKIQKDNTNKLHVDKLSQKVNDQTKKTTIVTTKLKKNVMSSKKEIEKVRSKNNA